MPAAIFGFLGVSLTDLIDILIVALIIFAVFRWIRNSTAINIFVAIIIIYVLLIVADALGMKLMRALLGAFIDVGVLALIVIFQPEIRHFLYRIGSETKISSKGKAVLSKIFGQKNATTASESVYEIAEACWRMSEQKTGALIVFPRGDSLDYIIATGDRIDATISRRLIMNIFFKNSPLHDGAMIIVGNHIVAARCQLPMTNRTDIPPSFGMRHRAAIGLTEDTDADVLLVSEESGHIMFMRSGVIQEVASMKELRDLLGAALDDKKS